MEPNYLHFQRLSCCTARCQGIFLAKQMEPTKLVTNYQKFQVSERRARGSHTKVCTISVTYAPGLIILITEITFVVAGMWRTFSHVPLSLALYGGFRGSLRVWVLYWLGSGASEFYL